MANPYWRYSRKQFRTEGQPLAPGPVAGKHIAAFRRMVLGHRPPDYAMQGAVGYSTAHTHYSFTALTFLPIVGAGQTVIPWPAAVRTIGADGLSTVG